MELRIEEFGLLFFKKEVNYIIKYINKHIDYTSLGIKTGIINFQVNDIVLCTEIDNKKILTLYSIIKRKKFDDCLELKITNNKEGFKLLSSIAKIMDAVSASNNELNNNLLHRDTTHFNLFSQRTINTAVDLYINYPYLYDSVNHPVYREMIKTIKVAKTKQAILGTI